METRRERSGVPAITSSLSPSQGPTTPCPFCGRLFKRLGCHIPKCKERGDRDYSAYLSSRRGQRPRREPCPKCHRVFRRLDTHLRVSVACRHIEPTGGLAAPGEPSPVVGSRIETRSDFAVSRRERPLASPVLRTRRAPRVTLPQRPLNLPKNTEEWVEADQLLTQVAPAVLSCRSVEEKNNTLCELIYNILRERFGIKPLPRARKRRQGQLRQHNRALKKVTELKNAARNSRTLQGKH